MLLNIKAIKSLFYFSLYLKIVQSPALKVTKAQCKINYSKTKKQNIICSCPIRVVGEYINHSMTFPRFLTPTKCLLNLPLMYGALALYPLSLDINNIEDNLNDMGHV